MARKVEVVAYNSAWPNIYQAEAERLRPLLRDNLFALYHIGSTAVPGLSAKATIDILAVVHSHTHLDARNFALVELGYQPKGENGVSGRHYFQKLDGEVHRVHIHAYKVGHSDIGRYLNFRDYLRAHPKEARAYEALKQMLADRFTYDPKQYTKGKSDFILSADRRAADWRAAQRALPAGGA
jgi:GrpB-like predicted nucleotidyltransferase (UPF0157 family)